jgi:hypothetical protein
MYKLAVPKNVEIVVVVALALFMTPWGIYFNKRSTEENAYKQIFSLLNEEPLIWGLLVLSIAYFSIVKPSLAIMLSLLLVTSAVASQ